jgi:type II secretory pathway component PulF
MAEIFGEMERYFQLELQLRRQFQTQTLWPKVQFVFATLIVAVLLAVLTALNPAMVPFPFAGLNSAAASLTFLGTIYGTLFVAWLLFRTVAKLGKQKAWMDRLLLHVPMVGPCLRALIMSRFTLALQLTLDTGLSIAKALRISLDATGNAYFVSHADMIALALKNGQPLHAALEGSGLFDSDFLDMVLSAEEGGSVPEMMRHCAEQYQDETKRRMTTLTGASAGLLIVGVGGFIIWGIFTFWLSYIRMLGQIR